MPTYQGGKAMIGRQIFEEIQAIEQRLGWSRKGSQYFEPFCGMLGVGVHFANSGRTVLANDYNPDLILLLDSIKNGWIPPNSCSKLTYERYRRQKRHSPLRGFYGFACGYSGIFYAGYRVKNKKRDFFSTFRRSLMNMKTALSNVALRNANYSTFKPKGMTIYCDPPYRDNKFGVKYFNDFDIDEFWQTMREWSKDNLVIVSEYQAPDDFHCVWEKSLRTSFGRVKRTERYERLFMAAPAD